MGRLRLLERVVNGLPLRQFVAQGLKSRDLIVERPFEKVMNGYGLRRDFDQLIDVEFDGSGHGVSPESESTCECTLPFVFTPIAFTNHECGANVVPKLLIVRTGTCPVLVIAPVLGVNGA